MKRGVLCAVMIIFLLTLTGNAFVPPDIKMAPVCVFCGMSRIDFAHSRMLVTYDDDTKVGTCSIHCLAIDFMKNREKIPMIIEVGDYRSKRLIDAEKAYWVLGGQRVTNMSTQAKWAFADKVYAKKFIREHSGSTLVTFEEALRATYESMDADTKMIREKRKLEKGGGGKTGVRPRSAGLETDVKNDGKTLQQN